VVILSGDSPLITPEALQDLLAVLAKADIAMLGFEPDDAAAYGRLLVKADEVLEIVEFKDASAKQREIGLCNSGIYALPAKLLFELLAEVKNDNAKGEFYLTDIVKIAAGRGLKTKFAIADEQDVLGVNTMLELAQAEAVMQARLCEKAMENGVQMVAPETVFLSADTKFGRDVILKPNVVIDEKVEIGDAVQIGPFAHLRAGTKLGNGVKIGNFVEVKNSSIGVASKVNHLSYIGDSEVGENVNIGAGTITCNYDGVNKYKTKIANGVFVGSNCALIAPVNLGKNAIIAAGSIITKDVEADDLAVSRGLQKNLTGGAKKFRERKKDK
jgi:bifunctional UDP-N-acetylglucosamine pyrophosphorylase/glucosamine-1-phosphate N-acetyltransferase